MEHPLSILRSTLTATEQKVRFWRGIAIGALLVVMVSFVATGAAVYGSLKLMDQLFVYKDNCVNPETASQLLQVSERVAVINKMCLASHRDHINALERILPAVFASDEQLAQWGVIDQTGGPYDDSDDWVQALPAVQKHEGRDRVLPRGGP